MSHLTGYLYAGTPDQETFAWTFNQQTVNPSVCVVHQRLNGPMAVGDVSIGQSVCGVTKG